MSDDYVVFACQVCGHDFGPSVPFTAQCHGRPLRARFQRELPIPLWKPAATFQQGDRQGRATEPPSKCESTRC